MYSSAYSVVISNKPLSESLVSFFDQAEPTIHHLPVEERTYQTVVQVRVCVCVVCVHVCVCVRACVCVCMCVYMNLCVLVGVPECMYSVLSCRGRTKSGM